MLVLTRRAGESFMVGSDITVTVISIDANQVRIGIAAPKEVPVHREEVFHRIRESGDTKKDDDADGNGSR
jgi:carbon storage regulator